MKREELLKLFCENRNIFQKSLKWYEKSFKKCKKIDIVNKSLDDLRESEVESLETLAGRYGRTVDILINRILLNLDLIEGEETGRKLDVVIRAEKRGFVKDYSILLELKDLRNELAHEYIDEEIRNRFLEIIEKGDVIMKISEEIENYIKKYKYC